MAESKTAETKAAETKIAESNEEFLVDIQDERLSFFTPAGEVKALGGVSFKMKNDDA